MDNFITVTTDREGFKPTEIEVIDGKWTTVSFGEGTFFSLDRAQLEARYWAIFEGLSFVG